MFFSGFFVWEEEIIDLIKKRPAFLTTFIPTSRSVFGSKQRSFKSFFSGAPRAARRLGNHHVVPLVSRCGLLLVRLDSPDSPDDIVHLVVCNLLARTCHELPPLECDWKFSKSGYAILTGVDCSSNATTQPSQACSAFFKVLIIGNDMYHQPKNLHSFTSGEKRWRRPSKFPFTAKWMSGSETLRNPHAVVWRGTAYWLFRYSSWHTIGMDGQTCHVSVSEIKTLFGHRKIHTYDEAQLTITTDGELSVFHMQKRGYQLEEWTRQEDGDASRWLCAPDVQLKPPRRMNLLILGEKGGMLLVKNTQGDVYIVDLDTGGWTR
uniref:Uncharacterized protein n=1 Tax=Avena sativa TaxID=4498 RepID=A0ACD5UIQ4_AVESA